MSFTLDRSCDWILRKFEACTCSGPGTVSPATGSAAIPTEALLEVIKPLVFGDPHVKSAVLMAALEPIIFRAPCSSLIQRLRDAAKSAAFGDELTELQQLPAYVAALNDLGHQATISYLTKPHMCERIVEIKRTKKSCPVRLNTPLQQATTGGAPPQATTGGAPPQATVGGAPPWGLQPAAAPQYGQ